MSLINNMLNELKKREKQEVFVPNLVIVLPKQGIKKIFLSAPPLWLVISVICILIGSYGLMQKEQQWHTLKIDHLINHKETIVHTPILEVPLPADAKWLGSSVVTGVTLQVKDNITELTFLLDHPVLYHLTSNDIDNQLTLTLDHTKLQSTLPTIDNIHSGIQRIDTGNNNDDTKIIMTLAPLAEIKYVTLNDADTKPELVVGIASSMDNNVVPTHSADILQSAVPMVKTPAMESLMRQQYQSAISDAENQQYQTAIGKLTDLIKTDANDKDARKSLVALLIDQNDQKKAEKIIDQGLMLSPDFSPFIELKARLLTAKGQPKAALALLQTSQPALSEDPDYYAMMAALYEQTNSDDLAIALYKQLLNINAHNANWWFGLGLSLDKEGKLVQAINAYKNAMAEGHLNVSSYSYLQNRLQELRGVDSNAQK